MWRGVMAADLGRSANELTLLNGDVDMRAVQLTVFGNPVDGLEYVDIPEPDAPGPTRSSSA
jgi:hypothetical protein